MAGHVGHLNIIRFRYDWDAPELAEFVAAIETVNAVADRAPGFVWRMKDEDAGANPDNDANRVFGVAERFGATLSVWESAEVLEAFTHRTLHNTYLKRRSEWMLPQPGPSYVIWPIAAGHIPTMAEARGRLERLAVQGPSDDAYDFAYLAGKTKGMSE